MWPQECKQQFSNICPGFRPDKTHIRIQPTYCQNKHSDEVS